jgi:hypothetical protein
MAQKRSPRNPRAAYGREVIAARRVGEGRKCTKCGETRPRALIPSSDPTICAKCDRKERRRKTTDNHHIAGKANNEMTIAVPVTDHRAELSEAQYEWPKKTLENPEHSPLLSAAAHIRGFVDILLYLAEQLLHWIVEMLELLDTHLGQKLGQGWWKRTNLRSFEPNTPTS